MTYYQCWKPACYLLKELGKPPPPREPTVPSGGLPECRVCRDSPLGKARRMAPHCPGHQGLRDPAICLDGLPSELLSFMKSKWPRRKKVSRLTAERVWVWGVGSGEAFSLRRLGSWLPTAFLFWGRPLPAGLLLMASWL